MCLIFNGGCDGLSESTFSLTTCLPQEMDKTTCSGFPSEAAFRVESATEVAGSAEKHVHVRVLSDSTSTSSLRRERPNACALVLMLRLLRAWRDFVYVMLSIWLSGG